MRKSVVDESETSVSHGREDLLDLEALASVEMSSEDPAHPFENALSKGNGKEWRAATPGPQTIRLAFDKPQQVRQIHLVFREQDRARSQEFALYATSSNKQKTELVRQQWSFSPDGSTTETEEYAANLPDLITLELQIDPGRHDKTALASLEFIGLS